MILKKGVFFVLLIWLCHGTVLCDSWPRFERGLSKNNCFKLIFWAVLTWVVGPVAFIPTNLVAIISFIGAVSGSALNRPGSD